MRVFRVANRVFNAEMVENVERKNPGAENETLTMTFSGGRAIEFAEKEAKAVWHYFAETSANITPEDSPFYPTHQ